MLHLHNISKHYKNKPNALRDISFAFPQTGIVALLGANGAGKSTLIRLLATLDTPSSGEICMGEHNIIRSPETLRQHLGYLPQHFAVYETLSGYEFLRYMAALKAIHPSRYDETIKYALAMAGLQYQAHERIITYSGGMKQRLGIAQAIIGNPKIIIFDEPTVGLDLKEHERFRALLTTLASTTLVILSTHIVSDIDHLADICILLKQGRINKVGSFEAVMQEIPSR